MALDADSGFRRSLGTGKSLSFISRHEMIRTFSSFVLAFLLVGCSSVPQQTKRLTGLASCCTRSSEFNFRQVRVGEETRVPIAEETPVFSFPEGKSYFSAFQLPPRGADGYALSITTFLATTQLGKPQVFCPSVTFYNAEKQRISTEVLMLSYQSGQAQSEGYWRTNAAVPAGAEYFALHTESRRVGNTLVVTTGANSPALLLIGPAFAYYNRGGPGQAKYECGHLGEVKLAVTQL